MGRGWGLSGVLAALALLLAAPVQAAGPFDDWAAVVVAGDWRGSNGGRTAAFDNARRDVSRQLERMGFRPDNIAQFSTEPQRFKDPGLLKSEPVKIFDTLKALSGKARTGCLVYFTSHGAPQGVLVGDEILPPNILARMLDSTCGDRPTVVVMSACFSGVFLRPLARPNRMILTAARPDRTSFGCSEDSRYPFFDDCVLKEAPASRDFAALAPAIRACVAAREKLENMTPPSEPQIYVGPELRPMLPLLTFPDAR